MAHNDIADRNVERLISEAYRPEPIDAAFAAETEEKLLAAGRSLAAAPPAPAVDAARLAKLRFRLSWAMAAAAGVAACWLAYRAGVHEGRPTDPRKQLALPWFPKEKDPLAALSEAAAKLAMFGQKAKPRPETPPPPPLPTGESLATGQGQRRRVALADGSTLYVNENTSVRQPAPRRLVVDKGEIYLEVSPRSEGERFVVQTPERIITALGTHFGVLANKLGAGVLVTQGKVKVSDVSNDISAGQQVAPGKKQPETAPRASHVLDWTRELMSAADASLVPARKHEGGALVVLDPNGQELQLSLRKYHIDVHLEDGFARTTIDQTYFNDTWGRLEGTFYFPLPPDASLSRLAMYVVDGKDCKLNEGGMAERDQARNAYETIRYERRDPALLEWVDGSTFKMRVFPLEAWQEKRIILSYTQRLPSLYGVQKYRFPGGLNMPVVRDWSFNAVVKNAANWDVVCASHPDAERTAPEENQAALAYRARHIKPDRDVMLELRERESAPGGASFATQVHDGQRYFMARYRPKLDGKAERQRRDWIVLFETSANRDPLLARTQIEVFRNLFKHAEYDDTVTLLTVNTRTQMIVGQAASLPGGKNGQAGSLTYAATPDNIQTAVQFLERAHLVGGCDLERALKQAASLAAETKNPHIVHLGAGVASLGEFKDDVLARLIPDGVRYIGVGIGKKWNRAFMKLAADRSGGYFTQINPDEPVAWRAFDLLATLNTPRLLDVRVIDAEEKATFLADAVTLAQGEDVCAFTRGPADKFFVPAKVIVSGKLDGKPLRQEIAVEGVGDNAGYLPRTWAKLEIDRLIADGQDKNKTAITALSKAMYVMSPFTSLLVLESEADYQRFNIDRGRKDHWAMYPAPERVPLVYEPDPVQRRAWWWHTDQPKDRQNLTPEQVLDSILVRLPAPMVHTGAQPYLPAVTTAHHIFVGVGMFPDPEDGGGDFKNTEWFFARTTSFKDSSVNGVLTAGGSKPAGAPWFFQPGGGERGLPMEIFGRPSRRSELFLGRLARLSDEALEFERLGDLNGLILSERLSERFLEEAEGGRARLPGSMPLSRMPRAEAAAAARSFGFAIRLAGRPGAGRSRRLRELQDLAPEAKFARTPLFEVALDDGLTKEYGLGRHGAGEWRVGDFFHPSLSVSVGSLDDVAWTEPDKKAAADLWMARLAERLASTPSASWLTYSDPRFQPSDRLFGDLVMYAPGLNVSVNDVRYILELEAKQERRPVTGKIDDAARKLIDRARETDWQAVRFPGVGQIPSVTVAFNGRGQFHYERQLSTGLRERVVCDGTTLWHLYPEIGLGAARPFNRHHHGELAGLIPWFMPSAEDLAYGADLRLVDARTVAVAAHAGQKPAKDGKSLELHLVFAPHGALAEMRLVEMPASKIVARQTYGPGGVVRLLDADGKTVTEKKLDLRVAPAKARPADVQPALDDLVVLDMPVRSGAYYNARMQPANVPLALTPSERLGYFAAMCFTGDHQPALNWFGQHYHAKGDRRLGFYTLLTLANASFQNQPNGFAPGITVYDVLKEHPDQPLARYLALNQKNRAAATNADPLPPSAEMGDGFIARLTQFRAAWHALRFNVANRDQTERAKEMAKVAEFIRGNTCPLFSLALMLNLNSLDTHQRASLAVTIADAARDYVEPLGLGYILDYQAAYHQSHKGDYAAAAQRFRKIYQAALEAGVLPKIDGSFRAALDDNRSGPPAFAPFMRGVVSDLLKRDKPHFAILAALQASQAGGQGLGDELLRVIQQQRRGKADRLELLAQLEYVAYNHVDARVEALCDQLLADKELAERPEVWRLSAAAAQRRHDKARALAHVEEALEREYRALPDLINIEAVRRDYRALLAQYLELARSLQVLDRAALDREAPRQLTAKVVKAADRWRGLDAEASEVCLTTAGILKLLGEKDLAWAYLTTPLALKPNESAPWLQMAGALRAEGSLEQADHAYARAFACESTNPQILWDRAQNLLQMGRVEEARGLWRQIAEGGWQERFQPLAPQARWHLEHQ